MEDDLVQVISELVNNGANNVLILIVVEDDLVPFKKLQVTNEKRVLILIVVEDDLVQSRIKFFVEPFKSLNPYCSGR